MKKVFLLLACVGAFSMLQAQVRLGVKGGMNVSTINGNNAEEYKLKGGMHIGGLVQIPVAKSFLVQPEIYFSNQGAIWEVDDESSTRLSYINVPVLAKYTSDFGLFAETGPQVGFLASAKDKYDGEKEDIKKYLKKTDFSWAFGAGYNITDNLGVNARYNLGLSSMYDGEKNSVVQVGVIYLLGERVKK